MAIILACDPTSLIKNASCFNGCVSTIQTQAGLVYMLELRRAQLSGTSVKTPAQLRAAAACLRCTPIDPVADGLDVAVAQEGAIISGVPGAAGLTIAQIMAGANAFKNMSISELRAIEIMTRCALQSF